MRMLSDPELIASYRASADQHAFHMLYERHAPRVFGLVLRLSGYRHAEAEEASQEAWIRAVERLGKFRGESSFSTWVCGIAIRCWSEHARRARRRDIEARPEAIARVEPQTDLANAIALLPSGAREVLVLHDVEGYTHREIGEMLGIEEGTSKSQLSHARRALRERLRPSQESGAKQCTTKKTT